MARMLGLTTLFLIIGLNLIVTGVFVGGISFMRSCHEDLWCGIIDFLLLALALLCLVSGVKLITSIDNDEAGIHE